MRFLRSFFIIKLIILFLCATVSVEANQLTTSTNSTNNLLSNTYSSNLLGITVLPDQPFMLDFYFSKSHTSDQTQLFIKDFLAALTLPSDQLWVNLSPFEADRIIPETTLQTDLGKDLLHLDYLLKKTMMDILSPQHEQGQKFWKQVEDQLTTQVSANDILETFHKVWIVPDQAQLHRHENNVFLVNATMKVMLEQDYVALKAIKQNTNEFKGGNNERLTDLMRQFILPAIKKEINHGDSFARLRQIYQSVILANWYKKNVVNKKLDEHFINKYEIDGMAHKIENAKETTYQKYLSLFKHPSNTKEEYDARSQTMIQKNYFTGGVDYSAINDALGDSASIESDEGILSNFKSLLIGAVKINAGITNKHGQVSGNQNYGRSLEDGNVEIKDQYEFGFIKTGFDENVIPFFKDNYLQEIKNNQDESVLRFSYESDKRKGKKFHQMRIEYMDPEMFTNDDPIIFVKEIPAIGQKMLVAVVKNLDAPLSIIQYGNRQFIISKFDENHQPLEQQEVSIPNNVETNFSVWNRSAIKRMDDMVPPDLSLVMYFKIMALAFDNEMDGWEFRFLRYVIADILRRVSMRIDAENEPDSKINIYSADSRFDTLNNQLAEYYMKIYQHFNEPLQIADFAANDGRSSRELAEFLDRIGIPFHMTVSDIWINMYLVPYENGHVVFNSKGELIQIKHKDSYYYRNYHVKGLRLKINKFINVFTKTDRYQEIQQKFRLGQFIKFNKIEPQLEKYMQLNPGKITIMEDNAFRSRLGDKTQHLIRVGNLLSWIEPFLDLDQLTQIIKSMGRLLDDGGSLLLIDTKSNFKIRDLGIWKRDGNYLQGVAFESGNKDIPFESVNTQGRLDLFEPDSVEKSVQSLKKGGIDLDVDLLQINDANEKIYVSSDQFIFNLQNVQFTPFVLKQSPVLNASQLLGLSFK